MGGGRFCCLGCFDDMAGCSCALNLIATKECKSGWLYGVYHLLLLQQNSAEFIAWNDNDDDKSVVVFVHSTVDCLVAIVRNGEQHLWVIV